MALNWNNLKATNAGYANCQFFPRATELWPASAAQLFDNRHMPTAHAKEICGSILRLLSKAADLRGGPIIAAPIGANAAANNAWFQGIILQILIYFANNGTSEKQIEAYRGREARVLFYTNATHNDQIRGLDVSTIISKLSRNGRDGINLRRFCGFFAGWVYREAKRQLLPFKGGVKAAVSHDLRYVCFDTIRFNYFPMTKREATAADAYTEVALSRSSRSRMQEEQVVMAQELTAGFHGRATRMNL